MAIVEKDQQLVGDTVGMEEKDGRWSSVSPTKRGRQSVISGADKADASNISPSRFSVLAETGDLEEDKDTELEITEFEEGEIHSKQMVTEYKESINTQEE